MSWPRRAALSTALFGLLACNSAQELQWDVRFTDPTLGPEVVAFEASIELGGCSGMEELYDIQFPAAGPGDAPSPPTSIPAPTASGSRAATRRAG